MDRRAQLDLRGVGLLVILGRGDDGLVELALTQPRLRRIVLVDPSPAAARGLPADPRLEVVTDPGGGGLGAKLHVLLRQVHWLRYLHTIQVSAPSGVDQGWAELAVASLRAAASASLRYYGNDPADALLGLRHVLANLPVIAQSHDLGPLLGSLRGRTAVVASAGPSLEDALPRLVDLQHELVIVAPDTSAKPLLAAGVRPHIVVAKERTERTIPLLEGVDAEGILLAALPIIPPAALAEWSGPRVSVYSGGAHFPWLGAVGLPRTALRFDGSAGNMAFRLCEELGAERIILVGQDLCFGAGGSTHVRGAANPISQEIYKQKRRIQVPGVAGRPVWSTPTWQEFIQVYEVDLQRFAGECINTSTHGALLRGATNRPLADALEGRGEPYDARKILADRLEPPPGAPALDAAVSAARDLIVRTRSLCEEGVAAASEAAGRSPLAGADVDELLEGPLSGVARLRAEILRQPLFHELLTPVVQSAAIAAETRIYGLQRKLEDDRDRLRGVAEGWGSWFGRIAQLAEATDAELARA